MGFADDYYANYGGLTVAEYVDRHLRSSPAEMARIRETVALLPAGATSALDVGAGHGLLLEALQAARGIAGVGVEITPAKTDYARSRGIDLRLGSAERLAFADTSFDAVFCCEVLEHLPFGIYEAALGELARVARQWLIVTVPYDEHRRFARCPYCSARVNPSYHFRSFAPAAMPGLIPGFVLERAEAFGAVRESLLAAVGRRVLPAAWPALLVCPACGFHAPAEASRPASPGAAAAASAAASPVLAAARALDRALPGRARPTWLAALYRRVA